MRAKQLITSVFFLLIITIVNGQTKNNYTLQWKKIDSLISQKGLVRSALTEVQKIYASAKKEKNDVQVIKALTYSLQLQEGLEENATQSGIDALEKEIASSAEPARSILKSILANRYWQYFQNNRYELYGRTTVKNFQQKDIETWDAEALIKKINQLFLESIASETLLQQTKLEPFDAIIIKGNVRYLRPTLFDLLAHEALSYFGSYDRGMPRPANAFELTQAVAFAEPERFSSFSFQTQDSLSIHFKAIQLYQRLLRFHLNDAKPDALIDADIARIQFAYTHSVMEKEDKEFLYRNALNRIVKKYPEEPAATQAAYLMAASYYNKAITYSPTKDTTGRFDFIKAKEIIEKIAARKDSVEGVVNSRRLLGQILQKDLSLQAEQVNVPGQPFRMLVTYRNISQMHVRILKMDQATRDKLGMNDWEQSFWQNVTKLPALKSYAQPLPATNDHQKHSVEIKVDALAVGEYALLTSSDKDFIIGDKPMALQLFYVSNISYIQNLRDYFVLNRETGQPLTDAKVQLWHNTYDYNIRKWKNTKGQLYEVDKNGRFRLNVPKDQKNRNNVALEITTATDRLHLQEHINTYEYRGDIANRQKPDAKQFEKENQQTFFFTDRSIYRPGQVVYFKGIVITRDFNTRNSKIIPSGASTVYLKDVNSQVVDSLRVTTNEFGSYSGKFTLPSNILNGSFRIIDAAGGEVDISVEEYKRPKFFVEYKKPEGTYRVNDTITITGVAKAYAGNNIDGATVSYRVVRQPRFIYPWLMWKIGNPRGSQQEIAHGETKTAADGTFTIRFAAIPDKSIQPTAEPVFDYEVSAAVTDINGETREQQTTVSVAYKALQLNVAIPGSVSFPDNILPADSLKNINISTKNMAGEFQKTLVTVSVYKLNAPQRLIRERLWDEPDQFLMSKDEYIRNFPYDEYSNETTKETWERLQKVYERKDSSKAEINFSLTGNSLQGSTAFEPGWYVIEVTAVDKYGQQVKDIGFVQLMDTKTGKPATPAYAFQYPWTQTKQPGETATIGVATSADNVFLIQEVDKYLYDQGEWNAPDRKASIEEKISYNFSSLSNGNKTFSFRITETDRGGFRISHAFVKHNRLHKVYSTVDVPWTNKELKITYETYRDKTLPGSQEKWKVKIAGPGNEKVAAEVLTAMYDASLDQFRLHNWAKPSVWPTYPFTHNWESTNFGTRGSIRMALVTEADGAFIKVYDELLTKGWSGRRSGRLLARGEDAPLHMKYARPTAPVASAEAAADMVLQSEEGGEAARELRPTENVPGDINVQIRKNFNETAFFFPDLKTDSAGNVEFSFTMPEALTQWKWMMLSHTKELAMAYSTQTVVTQKELMVQPNMPRFVREGDRMDLSAKLVNMSDKEMSGQIELQLRDATTNQSVDGWFQNMFPNQYFTVAAGQSSVVNFTIQSPYQFNKPLIVRFIARAGNLSDGEENAIPVLSNRLLVTETLPLNIRGGGTKNFNFEKLVNSGNSETLSHHALTVEFTSNPAWYAVQALPYLMEYPYECAEQVWNRVYANSLAAKIVNASPRIKQIFEKWKTTDTAALISNLQKNQELKSVLLEETPWVLEAKNETEQRKRIAMLFDMVKLSSELEVNISKLAEMQSEEGAFPWFKGGQNDRYITQYIVAGIGHLKKLNAVSAKQQITLDNIARLALGYLDNAIKVDYDRLVKQKADMNKQQVGYVQIHYLYARSFFKDVDAAGNTAQPFNYYRKQSQQFWLQQGRYAQGMIALSLFRTGDGKTSVDILRSLKQNAIKNEELGMYWKDMAAGYYWYQAPIETQALMIEAFTEITKDITTADALKTWLLKNKQTNNWRTTKATADACYALLLQGTDWLSAEPIVQIKLGDKNVSSLDQKSEAGSGYFKKVFDAPFVNSGMGNISVNVTQPNGAAGKPVSNTSWGAVYWQYFENLENITPAATPLKLVKKLFIEKNTERGPVLEPVLENGTLKVGDKVKVRIELRVDRDMEYVHMKDMRASSLEPVNVLSQWKWQGGLGYYEVTKDASTNFFFSYLPKGTYVFEYPLFVTHTGTFSNGITTIQCMYAPEFSSHSEGVKINVE
jgi:hypothetical protein